MSRQEGPAGELAGPFASALPKRVTVGCAEKIIKSRRSQR